MSSPSTSLKSKIHQRLLQLPAPGKVWTPVDFSDLGSRDAVDKTLQRLVGTHELRRIDRGLYDQPHINPLTGRPAPPDYRSVIDAVGRRGQLRVLIDGMTAANDLGLTTAVPAHVVVHTDGVLRPITLDKLTLTFKLTAPSKLYWADHPAMRVVQALYWLRDGLKGGSLSDQDAIMAKLVRQLQDPSGKAICDDLRSGIHTIPAWMQTWVGKLLSSAQPTATEAIP
jgi:hypothetical protein